MNTADDRGWSPYIGSALSGIVFILSVWFAGKFVGASTTFVRSAGMVERLFSAERVAKMDYFVKEVPKIDWQWMFVLDIFIGSLIASTSSGIFRWKALPDMWEERFWPKPNQKRHRCLHGWAHSHVRSPSGRWVTERP